MSSEIASEIERVPVPAGSLVAESGFTDYVDAYRVRLDEGAFPDVESFARAFLRSPPPWVGTLLRARDAAVGWLGLQTALGDDALRREPSFVPGGRAGIFDFFERRDDEILLGKNDKHLDFRLSILYRKEDGGRYGIVSTVVRFHGAMGRAYFVPVSPVHRRIVPAMLRATIETRQAG